MENKIKNIDLNTERAYQYVEAAKVYGKKVTFNLRTLLMDVPRERKLKSAAGRCKKIINGDGDVDLQNVSVRAASELVFRYNRFTNLESIYTGATKKYKDYYDSLMAQLKTLKSVKSYNKWKVTGRKKKSRLYSDAKLLNGMFRRDYMEDINRLICSRARVINSRKENIWEEYLNDPEYYEEGLKEYYSR